ncbi:MAG: deoxyhypusine synthase family protein [Candidatus Ranarchaeia archaeon]
MKRVHQIEIQSKITLPRLLEQMAEVGVLGAGSIGKAYRLLYKVFNDPSYTVMLSLAGPLVAAGLRSITAKLIEKKKIHLLITSGANIVHDIIESLGFHHLQGSFDVDDEGLLNKNLARIGNIFIDIEAFKALEDKLTALFPNISSLSSGITPSELFTEIGFALNDPNSILTQSAKQDVPIYSPGVLDSVLGLQLWVWSQTHKVKIDFLRDMDKLSDIVNEATKTAGIILGGGLPKHFTMGANILREGLDAAVQIVSGPAQDGSLSTAPLSEGVGWHKVKTGRHYVTVRGDATMVFPILIGALI